VIITLTFAPRGDLNSARNMSKKVEIEVAGKKVMVSNLDKVLYPAAGFTNGRSSTTTFASRRCYCRI
jgi:hypothetical protein